MKKLTAILGLVVISSFTGCSWLQEKLQGGVDEIDNGVVETAEEVSGEVDAATEVEATESVEVDAEAEVEAVPAE